MNCHLRTAAIVALASLATPPLAVIAYSNFGPGHAYEVSGGWTVSGPTSGFPTQVVAFQFAAQASGPLESVLIPMGHVAGTNTGRVILYKDSGSNTISDPLIQWTQALDPLGGPDLLTLTNAEDFPVLVAGTKYWLGTHYVVDDTWDAWNMTTVPAEQLSAFSYNGGDDYEYSMRLPAGAFEINVVPEPEILIVVGIGIAGLLGRRGRR